MRVDFVGVDFMGVDLVGGHPYMFLAGVLHLCEAAKTISLVREILRDKQPQRKLPRCLTTTMITEHLTTTTFQSVSHL